MRTRPILLAACCTIALALEGASSAKDHFLTIGGGYSPTGNQVSLEKNVQFFSDLLESHRPDHPTHDIYFADGDLPDRDLQYRDPDFECPRARRIVAQLFSDDDIALTYRNHELKDVRGPSSPGRIRGRLRHLGRELTAGDRLFIYSTAHGGSSWDEDNDHDTKLYMWNTKHVTASQFAGWLDQLPKDVSVVLVMVQCYSGGFSHTIFNQADEKMGMSEQVRCGFFSQVHDRVSAGCTPDVDQANYQEYSSFFWAALAGHDRIGATIPLVDFNDDGATSLAEAHGYAVIESETVDVPIRSSDAFLERYSKIGDESDNSEGDTEKSGPGRLFDLFAGKKDGEDPKPEKPDGHELLAAAGTLAEMAKHAKPIDRAIIEGLAAKLELEMDDEVKDVAQLLERAETKVEATEAKAGIAYAGYDKARDNALGELRRRWPELEADHPPLLAAFMAERSDEFVRAVDAMLSYQAMCKGEERWERLAEESLDAEKHEAKVRRLHFALRRVALVANLPKVASEETVARYKKLIDLETSFFSPPSPKEPVIEVAQTKKTIETNASVEEE